MPFKSQAQRGYLYANEPAVAKEFEKKTPKGKKLPYHVKGSKAAKKPDMATKKLAYASKKKEKFI